MNLRKRTLALLLTVCMLLSVAVPMVSAEDQEAIKIQLGTDHTSNWELFATSDGAADANSPAGSYIYWFFTSAMAKAGDWIAVRMKGTFNGEYNLTLRKGNATNPLKNGGVMDVYLLPYSDAADKQDYVSQNMTESNYLGQYDGHTSAPSSQDLGSVELDGDSFVLVFKPSTTQPNSKYRLYLAAADLLPIQTAADFVECADADSLASALTDNANIKLTADFAAGDVTLPADVTLDLNGHTLAADSFTCSGTVTDSSAAGNGFVVTNVSTVSNKLVYTKYDKANLAGTNVETAFEIAGQMNEIDNDTQKLWIKLTIENPEAYRVIATGNSGLTVGVNINWQGADKTPLSYSDADMIRWGQEMAKDEGVWGFYVKFTGLSKLESGKLVLTPTFGSFTSNSPIEYDHAA